MADGPVRGGFGLQGNHLLFGTEAGSIYAIDARDGRPQWRRSVGSPVLSTPAIVGSVAYFTTWDNGLHALDVASGRELWRLKLGQTLGLNEYWEYYVSSPVLSDGMLYVGSGDGRLYAIAAASGRIAWSRDLGARVRTTPAITGNTILVGTMSGHVVAVDRPSGRVTWRFATEGVKHDFSFSDNDSRSVLTAPIAVGDLAIAGGRDGNIYGIDLKSGAERWRSTHDGSSWILGLTGDSSAIYSGSGSAFLVQAANPGTGKEIWHTPTGTAMFGGLAQSSGVVVGNGSNGNLFGFDTRTGTQLWRFRLPDMSLSSPLIATDVIFTGSDDGSVFALDTAPSAGPLLDRYVFSYTNAPSASAFWFKPELLAGIRGGFLSSGFTGIGNSELDQLLKEPVTDKGRKIIVLADTRLPENVEGTKLRRFLDGGGILAMIGPDPLVYSYDQNGAVESIDLKKEGTAFSVVPVDKQRDYGYNVSKFTPAAARLGLRGHMTTIGWLRPDQVSTILAMDRSGMATAWIKRFSNGGQLIALPLPRYRQIDLSPYVNAINLAALASQ